MLFSEKAGYSGPFDASGIPQLDYHGRIGVQYNPIAIAQYGLGNYNLWRQHGDPARRGKFFRTADWLCEHLEINSQGWRCGLTTSTGNIAIPCKSRGIRVSAGAGRFGAGARA